MKNKEMKLEDVETPHTLGSASYILLVKFLDMDSDEEVIIEALGASNTKTQTD